MAYLAVTIFTYEGAKPHYVRITNWEHAVCEYVGYKDRATNFTHNAKVIVEIIADRNRDKYDRECWMEE